MTRSPSLASAGVFGLLAGLLFAAPLLGQATQPAAQLTKEQRTALEPAAQLNRQANTFSEQGRFAQAVPLAQQALAIYRKTLGSEHPLTANSINTLAFFLQHKGDYAAAEPLYREALATRRKVLGSEHPDTVISIINLALLLQDKGDYAAAEPLFREAMAIGRKVLGSEHPLTATSINCLAGLLQYKGENSAAEPLLREALAIRRKVLGSEHPNTANSVGNLAMLLRDKGDYAAAELLFREALAIRRKALGSEHPDTASSINNLAVLLQYKGENSAAEPLFREGLAIRRKVLGSEHPITAISINDLAKLLQNKSDYAAAEPLFREALAISRKALGSEHPETATNINNLALLLYDKGDYATAEPLFREALATRRKVLGSEHPDTATSIHNLAKLLKAKGDYAAAELLFREALAIRRKVLGNEHPFTAMSIKNLALLLQIKGDYAAAESLHREALAICRKTLGSDHSNTATSINALALLLQAKGDYVAAEPLFREALAIYRKALGSEEPSIAICINNLASLLHVKGDYAATEPLLAEAADVLDKARLRISGSGLERAAFTSEHAHADILAAVRARLGKPGAAFDALQRYLGRGLLDLLASTKQRPLTPEERTQEQQLLRSLAQLDKQIPTLATAASRSPEAQAKLDELRRQQDRQQAELARFAQQLTEKYGVVEGAIYPTARIQQHLPADAAMIAWVDAGVGEHWTVVLRRTGEPAWVQLKGSGKDGQWTTEQLQLAQQLRASITNPSTTQPAQADQLATQLRQQRLAPLLSQLNGVKQLIVIPSGGMLGVPVELIAPEFVVSYVPSPTVYAYLVERRRAAPAKPSLVALGDPPFSARQLAEVQSEPESLRLTSRGVTLSGPAASQPAGTTQSIAAGNTELLDRLPRLPGTRLEVQTIARRFEQPTILLGEKASWDNLMGLASDGTLGKAGYLHLATHGLVDSRNFANSCLILSRANLPNPLAESLAGRPVQDGRLTVGHVLGRFKLQAEMVVLSACDTGLGQQSGGEGYVGFAQAFLFAGAQSVVVSLWPVGDEATMLLMTRFYDNLLGQRGARLGKAAALAEAKNWLRTLPAAEVGTALSREARGVKLMSADSAANQPAAAFPFAEPRHWAAFVLIGDAQ